MCLTLKCETLSSLAVKLWRLWNLEPAHEAGIYFIKNRAFSSDTKLVYWSSKTWWDGRLQLESQYEEQNEVRWWLEEGTDGGEATVVRNEKAVGYVYSGAILGWAEDRVVMVPGSTDYARWVLEGVTVLSG